MSGATLPLERTRPYRVTQRDEGANTIYNCSPFTFAVGSPLYLTFSFGTPAKAASPTSNQMIENPPSTLLYHGHDVRNSQTWKHSHELRPGGELRSVTRQVDNRALQILWVAHLSHRGGHLPPSLCEA